MATTEIKQCTCGADHHAADRSRKFWSIEKIEEYINSDHPCCIPVGDACELLSVARLRLAVIGERNSEIVKLRRINEQLKDDIRFKQINYDAFYRMKELSEQRGREVAELQGQLVEAQFARSVAEDEASHLRAKAQRMVDASAQYVKAVENLLTSAGIKLPWLGENGVA